MRANRPNDAADARCFNDSMTTALPSLFVSHGSPMIALEPGEAGAFMRRLGPQIDATFGRPRAIVSVSAHTTARMPMLLAAARHEAIYDFGGFDPKLQTLRYDAPGAPALAPRVAALLGAAGIAVHTVAEGVLVLGSGSITHNLRRVFSNGLRAATHQPEIPESAAFRGWMQQHSAARDWDALFAYRSQAPHAVDMHPTDEHLLPWYVAAGAGGRDAAPVRLHDSVTLGSLGMDAYAFGVPALQLAAALQAEPLPP